MGTAAQPDPGLLFQQGNGQELPGVRPVTSPRALVGALNMLRDPERDAVLAGQLGDRGEFLAGTEAAARVP